MRLLVLGANGPTGRLVVQQALDAGHDVTAVTRKPDAYPLAAPRLTVAEADVTDLDGVRRLLADRPDAVVSTYGVPYSRRPVTVYSRGAEHLTRAMAEHGVRRLVCVTSTTVAAGDTPGESVVWNRGVHPLLRHVVGRTVYDDMDRMEAVVTASDLDWTIVRPGGLYDADEPSGGHRVAAGRLPGTYTSRPDLARALLEEATGPGHVGAVVEVLSPTGPPSPLRTMLKEAFGVGSG